MGSHGHNITITYTNFFFINILFIDNSNLLLQINYIIDFTNITNKLKYKKRKCNILAAKFYAIIYKFDIKK